MVGASTIGYRGDVTSRTGAFNRREQAAWRAYARHGIDPFGIDEHPRLDEVAVARALGRIKKGDRDALLLMVWADLTRLAGEVPPPDVAALVDAPTLVIPARGSDTRYAAQFAD